MKIIFAMLLLLASMLSYADLTDNENTVIDTNSNLEWLDLSLTDSLNYADALELHSEAGWNYATEIQFEAMMDSIFTEYVSGFGGNMIVTEGSVTAGQIVDFINYFGLTGDDGYTQTSFGWYENKDGVLQLGGARYYGDGSGRIYRDYIFDYDAYTTSREDGHEVLGTFLVRVKVVTTDTDGDGILDASDNCPNIPNPEQIDSDGDALGNACDADDDNDTVSDEFDNCPFNANQDQIDNDGDGRGDACDTDPDGDGIITGDNCPITPNQYQTDTDSDGLGDACDSNDDNDLALDGLDNCPTAVNDDQVDIDGDGIGDACDIDIDGDGVSNATDNCPVARNSSQDDSDSDQVGDACDTDDDNDGHLDTADNCPLIANNQSDLDGDGRGDACDNDQDGDGAGNEYDNCPAIANSSQSDFDGDGLGDSCDPDADGDGVANGGDICPSTSLDSVVDAATGCSIGQLCPCEGPRGSSASWRNHGKFVSCTAKTSESFSEVGLITDYERDDVVSEAAGSTCGSKK